MTAPGSTETASQADGQRFFKRTLHVLSLVAALGFLLSGRSNDIPFTLTMTVAPAIAHMLLLLLVLYLRSPLRWLLLRHGLDTLLKVGFLLAMAPLVLAFSRMQRFQTIGGLVLVLVGVMAGLVLFGWGVEAVLKRWLGERTAVEEEGWEKELQRLARLPYWRIALLLLPDLRPPQGQGSPPGPAGPAGEPADGLDLVGKERF